MAATLLPYVGMLAACFVTACLVSVYNDPRLYYALLVIPISALVIGIIIYPASPAGRILKSGIPAYRQTQAAGIFLCNYQISATAELVE